MMSIPEKCLLQTKDKLIVFKEKKSKLIFENEKQNEYNKITVDGCVITRGDRCDNLLESCQFSDQYFIELKGSDSSHAIKQLKATFEQLLSNKESIKKMAFIVFSNSTPNNNTGRQKTEKQFKKQYGVNLKFCRTNSKFAIER